MEKSKNPNRAKAVVPETDRRVTRSRSATMDKDPTGTIRGDAQSKMASEGAAALAAAALVAVHMEVATARPDVSTTSHKPPYLSFFLSFFLLSGIYQELNHSSMGHLCFSLSLLVLFLTIFGLLGKIESKTYQGDIEGLKTLKKGTSATSITPGSCLSSWDFSVDPCDNLFSSKFSCGFRCDLVITGLKRVTEISLDRAGYTGSLSSSTFTFPYLEILDFTDNSFTGLLPNSLSNMVRLRKLFLSGNSFSGYIPNSIGASLTKLEELHLDNNHLQGSIPEDP